MTSDRQLPWDILFAGDQFLFGEKPNAFLAGQIQRLASGGTALAVADGEGRNGVWLAEQGLNVLSVDSSVVAQWKAAKLAETRGVTLKFLRADLETWMFPVEHFDVVVAIFIQFSKPEMRSRIFDCMKKSLKLGGIIILEGFSQDQIKYQPNDHVDIENLYTEELLIDAFSDMSILEIKKYDKELLEGIGHIGIYNVIDFVALKLD